MQDLPRQALPSASMASSLLQALEAAAKHKAAGKDSAAGRNSKARKHSVGEKRSAAKKRLAIGKQWISCWSTKRKDSLPRATGLGLASFPLQTNLLQREAQEGFLSAGRSAQGTLRLSRRRGGPIETLFQRMSTTREKAAWAAGIFRQQRRGRCVPKSGNRGCDLRPAIGRTVSPNGR